jgi:hypothetical protein
MFTICRQFQGLVGIEIESCNLRLLSSVLLHIFNKTVTNLEIVACPRRPRAWLSAESRRKIFVLARDQNPIVKSVVGYCPDSTWKLKNKKKHLHLYF